MKILISLNNRDIAVGNTTFHRVMAGLQDMAKAAEGDKAGIEPQPGDLLSAMAKEAAAAEAEPVISPATDVPKTTVEPNKVEDLTEPKKAKRKSSKKAPEPVSEPVLEPVKEPKPDDKPTPEPVKEPKPDDKPTPAPTVTDRGALKKRLMKISRAGGSEEIRKIIEALGAEKLSLVPEDKLGELSERAELVAKRLGVDSDSEVA